MKNLYFTAQVKLIALFVVLTAFTTSIKAQQYTLTDDDVVVTDGVIQSCSYDFAVKDIVIPETLDGQTVVGIASENASSYIYQDGVFKNKGISSIVFPNTIKVIGDNAFYGNNLSNVTIPSKVIKIGERAFYNNNLLTELILPNSQNEGLLFENWIDTKGITHEGGDVVTSFEEGYTAIFVYTLTDDDVVVNDGVIQSCNYKLKATSIIIPETLDGQTIKGIGDDVFSWNHLFKINIPNSVTHIGANAFKGNKLTNINIPNGIVSIGNSAFANNQLTNVNIPNSVTSIGIAAFSYNQLNNITIPNSITSIREAVFNGNQLTSITIPNNITSIGDSAFGYNKLTSITITNSVTSIGEYAFSHNQLTNITIPNSVTFIGEYAFCDNQLTSITIPNSVTSIGNYAFYKNQLTSITIPNSVTSLGSGVFYVNKLTNITIPTSITSIGYSAFSCNQLTNITIPKSVTIIERNAFGGNYLTNITIPNSVTFIGEEAFSGNQLSSFILPQSIKDGHSFINWIDTNNKEYAGDATVTDLKVAYLANFTPNKYTISGKVTGADGITVALSGDVTDSKTINNGETFSFDVEGGNNVSVTATKQNFKFEKESYAFENISENKTDVNFTATKVATAINNKSFANFNCYPNPTNNTLFVELPADNNIASVNISDITGKVLYQAMNITDKVLSVDVSKFNSGILIVKVTNNKGVSDIRKVIKK